MKWCVGNLSYNAIFENRNLSITNLMKVSVPILLLMLIYSSCAQEKSPSQNDVLIQVDPELLSSENHSIRSFSFQIPKGWTPLSAGDSLTRIFIDPIDSSMMLVNTPKPNLSAFGEAQNSTFYHNEIAFSQNVYQNELMVLFEIKLRATSDSTDLYYAIPRSNIAQKAMVVESSIGSFESLKF